jgi:uncharacterized protein
MKRTVGNWVEGERFWNRQQELDLFIECLDEASHILLVAQRRIGKTSLMHEAARRIQDRYICLQINLENAHSPADAIAQLSAATRPYRSLWEKTKGIFANIVNAVSDNIDSIQVEELTVTLRSGLAGEDWHTKGTRLFAVLAGSEKPVIIFFDEVPILVNRLLKGSDYQITPERRSQTDAFMSWLRAMSQKHQGKIRLVVTGSVGLEPILRQAGLSATINHFSPFELGPWSAATAMACVEELAKEHNLVFQPGAIAAVIEQLGICIPYHVQLFFDQIYKTCKLQALQTVSTDLVVELYNNKMLSIQGHAELSHLEERLKLILGPALHPLALDLLTEAAVTNVLNVAAAETLGQEYVLEGNGQSLSDILREVLSILEHDGYLQRTENTYKFVSKLVKDWWNARYGFHFVPAAKRKQAGG